MRAKRIYTILANVALASSLLTLPIQPSSANSVLVDTQINPFDSGGKTTCALRAANEVFCVGDNSTGQLGDGTNVSSSEPVDTGVAGAYSVSVGANSVCAIGSDRLGVCWGDNSKGQLGNASSGSLPRKINLNKSISDISVGNSYACAVSDTDSLYCWGNLGSAGPDKYNQAVPTLVTEIQEASITSVGRSSVCVVSGSVYCWGSIVNSQSPVKLDGTDNASSISVGDDFACAVVSGAVKCIGNNSQGQLGQGNYNATTGVVTVTGISDAIKIVTGAQFACALSSSNNTYCWGNNSAKQISNSSVNQPTRVPTAFIGVVGLSAGENFLCAMATDASISCAGDNSKGQSAYLDVSAKPLSPGKMTSLKLVSAGANTTCAISQTNQLNCWGQIEPKLTTETTYIDVAVGNSSVCAIESDGSVWCWGANGSGQLGNNSTKPSDSPVKVEGIASSTVTHIAAGFRHFCASTQDGLVYCWGDNSRGQLGNFGNDSHIAIPVVGVGTASNVTVGDYHSCALVDTDKVMCWGDNSKKQIQNPASTKESPTYLGVSKVTKVAAGGVNTCLLTSDKKVTCIGDNSELQAPVTISGSFADLAVGNKTVCLIKDQTNQVSCLGSNTSLKLGRDGANSPTPVDINGLTAKAVSAGLAHNCVITSGNILGCWGQNTSGQLASSFGFPSAYQVPGITITGKLNVGESIQATTNSLERDAELEYSWYRATGATSNLSKQTGQDQNTVAISASDLGKFFQVRIQFSKWSTSSEVFESEVVGPVLSPIRLLLTPTPVISGKAKVGSILTVRAGRWDSGAQLSYQWYRGSVPIKGETKAIYRVGQLDVGKQLSVSVTGLKTGLPKVTLRSVKTAKVVR